MKLKVAKKGKTVKSIQRSVGQTRRLKAKPKASPLHKLLPLAVIAVVLIICLSSIGWIWLQKKAAVRQKYQEAMLLQEKYYDHSVPLNYLMMIEKEAKYTGYSDKVHKQINILKNKYAVQVENEKGFKRNYDKVLNQCIAKDFRQALQTTELLINVSQPMLRKKGLELQQSIKAELARK